IEETDSGATRCRAIGAGTRGKGTRSDWIREAYFETIHTNELDRPGSERHLASTYGKIALLARRGLLLLRRLLLGRLRIRPRPSPCLMDVWASRVLHVGLDRMEAPGGSGPRQRALVVFSTCRLG